MRSIHLFPLASTALLAACSHSGKLVYTSFGPANPAGDMQVVQTWEKSGVSTTTRDQVAATGRGYKQVVETRRELTAEERRSVVVLVDTIPEGIESSTSGWRATRPHALLGKFRILYGSETDKDRVLDDVRRVVMASGGNMALISWLGGPQESTWGAAGVVIRYDLTRFDSSKAQSGKIPSI